MRQIGVAERRARLGQRHRLAAAARADDPLEVAHALVALHATDPSSVYLAAWARMRDESAADVGAVERALYDRRGAVRVLGVGPTGFLAPARVAPVPPAAGPRNGGGPPRPQRDFSPAQSRGAGRAPRRV